MIANCDQNNHQIRFWLLNNYKIKVMIEFSDHLTQDNWYLTLATKVLCACLIPILVLHKFVVLIFSFK